MNRRDALRLLATSTVLQFAPHSLMAALREARILVGTETSARTLDAHQSTTVKIIAEMVLPKTETPGATEVGATEFIDLMLTEWYDAADRAVFVKGLADVDLRTQALFGKEFVECSSSQRGEILTALGEKMAEDEERGRDRPRQSRGARPHLQTSFYPMLRRLTLTAYYTSEAGATEALNFQIIPDRYDGCAEMPAGKERPEGQ
jgi:hypothetical protein